MLPFASSTYYLWLAPPKLVGQGEHMTISTTQTRRRRRWRFTLAATLTAGIAGLVSASPSTVFASTEKVVIYFAVCDGSTSSDTVKIKKINEDGTGLTVVGDTTIDHCDNNTATRFFSGLAVSGDYAYFSWISRDASAAGIGRISTSGGTAEVNFANAPAGIGWFQMSPTPLDGHLYVSVYDAGPSNYRIMRLAISSGQLSDCYQPAGSTTAMSIGVGKDAVYYATSANQQKLYKVSNNCTSSSEAFDFNVGSEGIVFEFDLAESSIGVIAESDNHRFLKSIHMVNTTYQLLQVDKNATALEAGMPRLGTTADPSDQPTSQVWGFNYLYFKDGAARKMYRVKPGGTVERAFEAQIPGEHILHHFSVVKEIVTPATPPPATKAPLVISKKGVTGKQIARDLAITIPKRSKITLTVAKKSRKVCAVKKSRVVSTKKGKTCRVTVTITPKKGKAIKRTTSFTTS